MPVRAIAILALAAFASAASLRIVDSLLPEIAREFSTTVGAASLVVTAFTLAYGAIQLVFGPLGDRFGKYETVAVAVMVSALASLACAFADSLAMLAIARAVAGAAAGGIIPLAMAWIGDVVPYERRQPILARFLSGQIMGLIFGQVAGGVIGDLAGWRSVFVVIGALYVLAGFALVLALWRDAATRLAAKAAAHPAVTRFAVAWPLLSRTRVRLVLGTVFVEGILMFGAFAYVGTDLQHRMGVSLAMAGAILASFGLGGLAYALVVNRLVQAFGRARMSLIGAFLLALAFVLLAVAPHWSVDVPALALAGLGFYMFHNTLQTEATQMIPEARGLAVTVFAACLFMGQAFGVGVAGPFFDRYGAAPIYALSAVLLPLVALRFRRGLG